jgi:metal-sulfur cluster biosynthetic enzyme
VAGATGAAATGAASATDSKSFGLTRHTPPAAEEGPSQIQAKVTRIDADRWGHVRLSLDNGQAWTFDSMNPAVREGEAVKIKRGVAGSFHLTTAEHHTYRVERAQ